MGILQRAHSGKVIVHRTQMKRNAKSAQAHSSVFHQMDIAPRSAAHESRPGISIKERGPS